MVEYLRTSLHSKYAHSLDHITTDVVIDLYDALIPAPGEKWDGLRISDPWRKYFYTTAATGKVHDTAIVEMQMAFWQSKIISKHLLCLERTGYETL